MADKYDEAIAYLTKHPNQIRKAWNNPGRYRGGCLFQHLTPTGRILYQERMYGCPSLIRQGDWEACDDGLTKAAQDDERIPVKVDKNAVSALPAFAEIQRLADKLLGRE